MGYSGNMYAQATEVITSQGDLRRGDSSGNPERLAIGSSGKVLQSNGTTESWETLTTADSVLTTQGDILYEGGSGLARLGQSTDGHVLTTKGASANPVWAAAGGGASFANQTQNLASTFTTSSTSFVTVTSLTHTGSRTTGYSNVTFVGSVSANDAGHVIEARITKDGSLMGQATYEGTGSTPQGNYKNFVQTFWVTSDTVDFDFDVLISNGSYIAGVQGGSIIGSNFNLMEVY